VIGPDSLTGPRLPPQAGTARRLHGAGDGSAADPQEVYLVSKPEISCSNWFELSTRLTVPS
jgi:hypothetical protein